MLRRFLRINGLVLGWIVLAIIVVFGTRVWSLYDDGCATFLQVTMRSSVDGKAVVYYDMGEGLSEKDSEQEVVEKGDDLRQYRFRLPNRTIHYLRFDPLSSEGHIEIQTIRVTDGLGKSREEIALSRIKPIRQIAKFEPRDQLISMEMEEKANDPQLLINFPKPVQFNGFLPAFYKRLMVEFLAITLAVILLSLWAKWKKGMLMRIGGVLRPKLASFLGVMVEFLAITLAVILLSLWAKWKKGVLMRIGGVLRPKHAAGRFIFINNKLLFLTLLLIGIIQGGILWADHHPMFFFGDSESYIWTALTGWLPPDRSFVYGYFIRLVSVTTESLTSLVIVQVFLASLTCLISVHLLIRYFRVRSWIAFGAAFVMTLEPLQLLYARYVMTETLALFVFVFYVWAVLHYFEIPRLRLLLLLQMLAVLMISIRFAFIPLVWICVLVVPLMAIPVIAENARAAAKKPFGTAVLHVALSFCLLFTFTTIYKYVHGSLQDKPPAYSYVSGFFTMGFVIPILEPGDFADKTLGEQVLKDLSFPIADRRWRAPQHWMEGGAVSRLKKLEPDRIKADAIAREAAFHAVIHKPLAFLQLGWQTFTDYFDQAYLRSSMETDLGNCRGTDEFNRLIKTRFHYTPDSSSALDLKTITGQYFLRSGHWIQLLLFLPFVWGFLLVFTCDTGQRCKILMMVLISSIFIGEALFLVMSPTPRYLHIPAWLACMAAGAVLNRVLPRQSLFPYHISEDAFLFPKIKLSL